MGDIVSATTLAVAEYTFNIMADLIAKSLTGPPQVSLVQSQEDSAKVVIPLLQAASALVGATREALTDHEGRLSADQIRFLGISGRLDVVETLVAEIDQKLLQAVDRISDAEAVLADHEVRLAALEAR